MRYAFSASATPEASWLSSASRYDCAMPHHRVARVVAVGIAHRSLRVRVLRQVGEEDRIDLVDEPVAHEEPLGDVGRDPGVGSTGGAGRARHIGVEVVERDGVLAVDDPATIAHARRAARAGGCRGSRRRLRRSPGRCAGDVRRGRAAHCRRPGSRVRRGRCSRRRSRSGPPSRASPSRSRRRRSAAGCRSSPGASRDPPRRRTG